MRLRSSLLVLFAAAFASATEPPPGATVSGAVRAGDEPAWRVALLLEPAEPFAAAPPGEARLDEVWLSFVPKVQLLPVGTTLHLANKDDSSHTVHAWSSTGKRTVWNHATAPGGKAQGVTLDAPGVLRITCDMHREMRATIVVTRSPFVAVTDEQGRFAIPRVPPGRYRLRAVWERGGLGLGEGPEGAEPGEIVDGAVTVAASDPAPLQIQLPPVAIAEDAPPPPPIATTKNAPSPWWRSQAGGLVAWPSGWLVWLLAPLGFALAFGLAVALHAAAHRARAPRTLPAIGGTALAMVLGLLSFVGLHGTVAVGLAVGMLLGAMLGGAPSEG